MVEFKPEVHVSYFYYLSFRRCCTQSDSK